MIRDEGVVWHVAVPREFWSSMAWKRLQKKQGLLSGNLWSPVTMNGYSKTFASLF
jgi:hypothetical protein